MPNDGRSVSASFDKTWSLGHLLIAASVLLPSLTAIFLAGSWFERVDESIQALLQQEKVISDNGQVILARQMDMTQRMQNNFDAMKDQIYSLQTQVYTYVLSRPTGVPDSILPTITPHRPLNGAHQ